MFAPHVNTWGGDPEIPAKKRESTTGEKCLLNGAVTASIFAWPIGIGVFIGAGVVIVPIAALVTTGVVITTYLNS
jgi:hypothetical protein